MAALEPQKRGSGRNNQGRISVRHRGNDRVWPGPTQVTRQGWHGEGDSRRGQVDQANAQISLSQAQLKTAELNLSYTDVKSPIAGRIGKANITQGNLVSPQSGPLVGKRVVVAVDGGRLRERLSSGRGRRRAASPALLARPPASPAFSSWSA